MNSTVFVFLSRRWTRELPHFGQTDQSDFTSFPQYLQYTIISPLFMPVYSPKEIGATINFIWDRAFLLQIIVPCACLWDKRWSVSIFSLLVQRENGQKEKAREGKGFRFPFPWILSLKRQRRGFLPSFDSPRRGTRKKGVLLTRENRGGHCRPCEEACSETEACQISTPEGRFSRGGIPLLKRFN